MRIYKCNECSWATVAEPAGSIGTAHAHAEKHAKAFGILPAWLWPSANPDRLESFIDEKIINDSVDMESVDGLVEGFCSINDVERSEEERFKHLIREVLDGG